MRLDGTSNYNGKNEETNYSSEQMTKKYLSQNGE